MQEVLWIMRCEWIERCWQIVCSIQGSANLLLDLLVPMHSTQYNVPCFGWEHIRFHESERVHIFQMSTHHTDAFPGKKLWLFGSCIFKVWMTLWRITKLSIPLNQFSHGWPSIGRKEPHRVTALRRADLSSSMDVETAETPKPPTNEPDTQEQRC